MATKILDLYAELTLDNSSYMEGVERSEQAGASFEKKIKNNAKNTQSGFENLSGALSICKKALATFGIGFSVKKVVDGLSQAYEEANKLDVKLRGASTLFGDVAVNQSQLADNLKKISLQTGESLETLGQTVYDAMSAGVQPTEDMANVLKVVSTSSKLAKAGFTDTNTAMKASLSVINAYGMGIDEVNRVSDILLQTQNLGVTTVGELGNALSKVTPTASAFGVSIENVTTSLVLMTKQGTNTEVASTGLSSILSELGKNGTTASENLAKASKSAGLTETSFKDLLASGKSLGDILDLMADYAEQNNLSLVDMFSSIEAGKSALQLTNGGAETFNTTLEDMKSATGLVEDGFEKMLTPSEKLDSAFAVLKETIGEKLKPALDWGKESLANFITKMVGGEETVVDFETTTNNLSNTLSVYEQALRKVKERTDETSLSTESLNQNFAKAETEFSNASKSILSDTELTKVGIYTSLKDLSQEYELTLTDMEILSQAKAEANREIWGNFATGFKQDMETSFYSVMQSFETLGEALVNSDDMWESFSSIALNALKQILGALGNQLTTMAVTKAVMGDWGGAGLATAGAIFAYTGAGAVNAQANKLLNQLGSKTGVSVESEGGTTEKTQKTEEERKQEQIAGLEDEANMLQSIIDNIETGAEIPEQYQQDVKIRELNDRIRELESKITSLQDRKDVTINQIIDTVPMTPYELEQQAYIMAERLQWS